MLQRAATAACVLLLCACAGEPESGLATGRAPDSTHSICPGLDAEVNVLVCNLHGLDFGEEGLLDLAREEHLPAVGRALARIYTEGVQTGGQRIPVDIVALQEVFANEGYLADPAHVGFPHAQIGPTIRPGGNILDLLSGSELASHLGSALGYTQHAGLLTLSRYPMRLKTNGIYRDVYKKDYEGDERPCTSVDCLADKGYSITGHRLAPGCEELQVVNTHLQAGKKGDFAVDEPERVRAFQTRKLLAAARSYLSFGRLPRLLAAVGDFNFMDQRTWGGPDEYDLTGCAPSCDRSSGPALLASAGLLDTEPGSKRMMHVYRAGANGPLSLEPVRSLELWLRDPAHARDGWVSGEPYILGGPYPFTDPAVNGVETGDKACRLVSFRAQQEAGSTTEETAYEGMHATSPWAVETSAPYPNPFREQTKLEYVLPAAAAGRAVTISVYDLQGRLVRELIGAEPQAAGPHAVTWRGDDASGRPVASGAYLIMLLLDGEPQRAVKVIKLV